MTVLGRQCTKQLFGHGRKRILRTSQDYKGLCLCASCLATFFVPAFLSITFFFILCISSCFLMPFSSHLLLSLLSHCWVCLFLCSSSCCCGKGCYCKFWSTGSFNFNWEATSRYFCGTMSSPITPVPFTSPAHLREVVLAKSHPTDHTGARDTERGARDFCHGLWMFMGSMAKII